MPSERREQGHPGTGLRGRAVAVFGRYAALPLKFQKLPERFRLFGQDILEDEAHEITS